MFKVFIYIYTIIFTLNTWAYVHHDLEITIDPQQKLIQAIDQISNISDKELLIQLNSNLQITMLKGAEIIRTTPQNTFTEIQLKIKRDSVNISYSGTLSDTTGISAKGIALFGSDYWFPTTPNSLITFTLKTNLPDGWISLAQGQQQNRIWKISKPQKTIYLMANKFFKFERQEADVLAQVYLLNDEPQLAEKFLNYTHQYIKMYAQMLGPYPYSKFALVENFWETGFGMPSFTLLGPTVTHLPFIFYTSYPHEILHNWWGNSVYVDYSTGNWCEGLTTYLADHLLQSFRHHDSKYRKDALKKFTNFVNETNDFPLTQFQAKYDAASEAIGYSKSMMFFHMLKIKLGESNFYRALQHFYQENKFKTASFSDIKKSFEYIGQQDLSPFFTQWLTRTGAPKITISDVIYKNNQLTFKIGQHGPHLWTLLIPYHLVTNSEIIKKELSLEGQETTISLEIQNLKQLKIDPLFDVFRTLDINEVAPTIGSVLGASNISIIVPAAEKRYYKLAQELSKNLPTVEIINDHQTPQYDTIIILGQHNKQLSKIPPHPDFSINDKIIIKDKDYTSQSVVLAQNLILKDRASLNLMFVTSEIGMEKRIAQKLLHYGKYSAVAFKGEDNTLKTEWNIYNSPLIINF